MARSSYVYVVMDPPLTGPIAGFTVKHEMVTFLKGLKDTDGLRVFAVRDNREPWFSTRELSVSELLS